MYDNILVGTIVVSLTAMAFFVLSKLLRLFSHMPDIDQQNFVDYFFLHKNK